MESEQKPTETPPARRRGPRTVFADFLLVAQDRVLWPLADALRGVGGRVGRTLSRGAEGFKQSVLWPVTDRFALLPASRRIAVAAGSALVVAVGVVAALGSGGGSGGGQVEQVAVSGAPVTNVPVPQPAPEPTLHGPTPAFTPPAAKAPAKAAKPEGDETGSTSSSTSPPSEQPAETTGTGSAPAGTEKIGVFPTASRPNAAEASEIPGPTAGVAALAVAREFSSAFVVYETRGRSTEVRKAFSATATPKLAKALLERPPRQPAKGKVPKARVLNIVAGPSRGGVFTVSVSLLRVGVTSELRLEMEKLKKQGWLVTNVLG